MSVQGICPMTKEKMYHLTVPESSLVAIMVAYQLLGSLPLYLKDQVYKDWLKAVEGKLGNNTVAPTVHFLQDFAIKGWPIVNPADEGLAQACIDDDVKYQELIAEVSPDQKRIEITPVISLILH